MVIAKERSLANRLVWGAAAGAAGSAALNIVTYGDMLLRGRPSSGAPAQVAGTMAEAAGIHALSSENDDEKAKNRRSAAGALLGYLSGIGVSMTYSVLINGRGESRLVPTGVALGLAAMVMADVPIVVTGNGDPRTWSTADWLSDLIPHLAYGLTSAAVLERR